MNNVIDLSERRERRDNMPPEEKGYVACWSCDGGWFELRDGAVCFAPDGRVTGWTGTPVCVSCQALPKGTA